MSVSSPEVSVPLISEDVDRDPINLLRSVDLLDSAESELWLTRHDMINKEVQDIMVDVVVLFSALPVLKDDHDVLQRWYIAFESLFDIVKGMRQVMDSDGVFLAEDLEGRHGRLYLSIEREYFVTCFFEEFHDILSLSELLGDLQEEYSWTDPIEDLIGLYKFIVDRLSGSGGNAHRRSRRMSRRTVSTNEEIDAANADKELVIRNIKQYLDLLVDAGSNSDESSANLMVIAKAIDLQEDTSVQRFLLLFRKREFYKLYSPVQKSVNGEIFVKVLAKYYLEYAIDPRIFNAPSYETIVKEILLDPLCDSDVQNNPSRL